MRPSSTVGEWIVDNNGAVVADLLISIGNFLKTAFWFLFYPPIALWNESNIWCQPLSTCPPTAKLFSIIAWVLLLVMVGRFLALSTDWNRRNLILFVVWAGCYYGLPQLYGGLWELDRRAYLQEQQQRRMNSYR